MSVAILAAKAALAVMLLVAGGAKLADLAGFATAIRLFLPPSLAAARWAAPAARRAALAVAGAELALGAISLAAPGQRWANVAVGVLAACFVAVSGAGYAFRRGRSCRCFGALSRRRYDLPGVGRAVLIAALAWLATASVPAADVALSLAAHALLAGGGALLAFVTFWAARGLAASRESLNGVVP